MEQSLVIKNQDQYDHYAELLQWIKEKYVDIDTPGFEAILDIENALLSYKKP